MKIDKLVLRNFKGQNREVQPGIINVIRGDNFSGKSTVIEGVTVAMLGYHPAFGKRASELWNYSSDPESCGVQLNFSDGSGCGFNLEKVKGTIKADHSGNPPDGTSEFLFNLDAFFAMTKKQRNDYMMKLLKVEWNVVAKKIESILDVIDQDLPDLEGDQIKEAVAEIREGVQFHSEEADEHKLTGDQLFKNISDWVANKISVLTAKVKSASSAAQGIVSGSPEKDPTDRSKDIEAIRKRLWEVQSVIETASQRRAAQESILKAEQDLASLPDRSIALKQIEDLEKATADIKSERGKVLSEGFHKSEARYNQLIGEINRFEDIPEECPCCGISGPTYMKRMKSRRKDELSPLQEELKEVESQRERYKKDYERFQKDSAVQEKRINELSDLRLALNEIDHAKGRKNQGQEALKNLGSPSISVDEVEALKRDLEARLSEAESDQQAYHRNLGKEEAEKEQRLAVLQSGSMLEGFKAFSKRLEKVKMRIINERTTDFLKYVNQFTEGFMSDPIEFRDWSLGRKINGKWVALEAFSGLEKALTECGFKIAIAATAQLKLVIIDEVIMDDGNFSKVLARLESIAKNGLIDQAFIVTAPRPVLNDWKNKFFETIEA